jgi:hypothetical protein
MAGNTYHFSVFAFNGPVGFENYLQGAPLAASVTTPAGDPASYYTGVNAGATNFITQLSQKIGPHDTVFYGNYIPTMINLFETRDTSGGQKVVNCVYTGLPYVYADPFVWNGNGSSGKLTREHSFAQSWMPTNDGTPGWFEPNGRELLEYNDLHHLFPADQLKANAVRSNNPFGEVVTLISQNGQGKLGYDVNGKKVYEPRDAHKGDAARAIFYMEVAYNGVRGKSWSLGAVSAAVQHDSVLKKWHAMDPPDAWEIARNEFIQTYQHNRNPFIDHPDWTDRINFNNLTYIPATTPALDLISPNGGETFENNTGAVTSITWSSALIDSVTIEFLVADTLHTVLAPAVSASAGTWTWALATSLPQTTNAKIRLRDLAGTLSSTSASPFTITMATGIEETWLDGRVNIYPNPAAGHFNVDAPAGSNVKVYDISGRIVVEKFVADGRLQFMLNQAGVYVVEIESGAAKIHRRLIAQ